MFGGGGGGPLSILIPVVIVAAVVLLRNRQARKLRIELLWIRPAIFLVLIGATLIGLPPPLTPTSIALMAGGLAIGCAFGWQRGRMMRIAIDADSHELTVQASPLGMLFIIVLMAVRYSLNDVMQSNAGTLHLPILAISDGFVLLAGGMMMVMSLEMWLRSRKMLAEAIAAKAARGAVGVS